MSEVVEERNGYRARIEQDIYPSEPEFDAGSPVVRVSSGRSYFGGDRLNAEVTDYGIDSAEHSGLPDNAADIIEKFGSIESFERYLKIFHGGEVITYGPNRVTDFTYVSYTTAKMIEHWGCEPELGKPNMDEWIAYLEGDTWTVVVEQQTVTVTEVLDSEGRQLSKTERETWTEVDACGGFYGSEHAEDSARENLSHYAGEEAA